MNRNPHLILTLNHHFFIKNPLILLGREHFFNKIGYLGVNDLTNPFFKKAFFSKKSIDFTGLDAFFSKNCHKYHCSIFLKSTLKMGLSEGKMNQ